MSRPVGDKGAMHDRVPPSELDGDFDAAFGDAVRHAYAHAAKVDELVARRHAKAAAGVVQRGEVGSWWRTAELAHRRRRIGTITAKAAAVTVLGMVGSTGLAAANVLPAPAARAIVRVVTYVGLPVPQPIETAAETKTDIEAPASDEVASPPTSASGGEVSLAAAAESSTSSSTTATSVTATSDTTATSVVPATTVTTIAGVADECVSTPTTRRPVVPPILAAAGEDPDDSTTTTTAGEESTTTTTSGEESTTTTTVADEQAADDACAEGEGTGDDEGTDDDAQGEGLPPDETTTSTTDTTVPDETAGADDPTPTTLVEDAPAAAEG